LWISKLLSDSWLKWPFGKKARRVSPKSPPMALEQDPWEDEEIPRKNDIRQRPRGCKMKLTWRFAAITSLLAIIKMSRDIVTYMSSLLQFAYRISDLLWHPQPFTYSNKVRLGLISYRRLISLQLVVYFLRNNSTQWARTVRVWRLFRYI
jgi:hypothetical protein